MSLEMLAKSLENSLDRLSLLSGGLGGTPPPNPSPTATAAATSGDAGLGEEREDPWCGEDSRLDPRLPLITRDFSL